MATYRTYEAELNPNKALIFRIVHISNIPWILEHGMYCGNSATRHKEWVSIGKPDLISSRAHHRINRPGAGVLGDYVPFYFTPRSPMLMNISTGRSGATRRRNEEIAILVSSLRKVHSMGLPFLFTSAHAYTAYARFYDDLADLRHIDWGILQRSDFQRDQDNDPGKTDRYQAEALVRGHMPVTALLGILCYTEEIRQSIAQWIAARQLELPVFCRPGLYF